MQIACPDASETVKDADILVFVIPHQVSLHDKPLSHECIVYYNLPYVHVYNT